MPYVHLFLALLSSVTIMLLLRRFESQGKNRLVIIAANYIVAGSLALLLSDRSMPRPGVLVFGFLIGLLFFLGFIAFSLAIKKTGIATTVTIGRLSLAIPVALSILFWGETPLPMDILALGMIFFIILAWEGRLGRVSPLLLFLFLLVGTMDAGMKFFKIYYPWVNDGTFLIIVFYSAMFWGWGYILFTRQKVKGEEFLDGLGLGVPNFFSSYFLLKALRDIPAYTVFPVLNTGIIVLSALLGYLIFKEKLNARKLLLILLGILAMIFLTTRG